MGYGPPFFTISPSREIGAYLFMGGLAAFALCYSVWLARRERSAFPIYLFLGAGLGVCLEPFVDLLGHCTFPQSTVTQIRFLGFQIPLYIGLCYFFYFCTPVLWLMKRIERGMTRRDWLRSYAATVVFCLLFEPPIIAIGWETYYGANQPFKFFGLPFWWGFLNSHTMFATAVIYFVLRRYVISDRMSFLFVPLVPVTLLATYGAAMPVFIGILSTDDTVLTNLGAVLASAIAVLSVWILGTLVETKLSPRTSTAQQPAVNVPA